MPKTQKHRPLSSRCPYTAEELHELETLAMAYRYAYYVDSDPLTTDYDYDQLEAKIRPWLPPTSPMHKVGSSLPDTYTAEQLARVAQLRGR